MQKPTSKPTTHNALSATELKTLRLKANEIRRWVIEMVFSAKSGHIGGALSIADVLSVLYFKELNVDPKNPNWDGRDRLALSKGHASAAYYAALALRGFFPKEELLTFRKINSKLQGHAYKGVPGVDVSTGSLGQGICVSLGMALAAKMDGKKHRVYAIIGDGECDEGSVWEAALNAPFRKLDNLTVILDRNEFQNDGSMYNILDTGSMEDKFSSFGWNVISIDGHDMQQIVDAIEEAREAKSKPSVIVAHTIKGKGVSFMENNGSFHGKPPTEDEFEKAIAELDEARSKI